MESTGLELALVTTTTWPLPIPELKLDDLQDNIWAVVVDALTTVLEEEMAVKSAAARNKDDAKSSANPTT